MNKKFRGAENRTFEVKERELKIGSQKKKKTSATKKLTTSLSTKTLATEKNLWQRIVDEEESRES